MRISAEIEGEILGSNDLRSEDLLRESCITILHQLPDLKVDRYGIYEPVRNKLDDNALDDIVSLSKRANSVLMKGKGTLVILGKPTDHERYTRASLTLSGSANVESGIKFVDAFAKLYSADFAFMHRLAEDDINYSVAAECAILLDPSRNGYTLTVSTKKLTNCVPDIYWYTVFGRPYIDLFGRETILSAPANRVLELSSDLISLQLSDKITDLQSFPKELREMREAIKRHLGPDSFFDPAFGPGKTYRVPYLRTPIHE